MNKPRRPWLAALLTFISPGLGHIYTGRPGRGFMFLATGQVLVLAFFVLLIVVAPTLSFLIIGLVGSLTYAGICIADAVIIARKKKQSYELSKYNRWYIYLGYYVIFSFLPSTLLSGIIRANIVQAYNIPSGAMIPTVPIGDQILTNKYIYKSSPPKRGDIIIFPYPEDPSRTFIKRLIAVEGDVVEIKNKRLYLNGKEQHEPYIINSDTEHFEDARETFGPVTVPAGMLFFMGDNRDQSYDSRFYGFVPKASIKGKAISIYWSWNKASHSVRWERIGKLLK